MTDIDFNKILGINVNLKDWKDILDERKTPYVEFHDVKKVEFQEFKIKEKKIPILLLMKSSHWRPKNGSAWGSSGPDGKGGYDISNYGLTNEEIKDLIGHLLDDEIQFITNDKNMKPSKCQHIVTKNSCDREKEKQLDLILRNAATEKFKSKDTTKRNFIHINDCVFEYTSDVTERIGEKNEGVTYAAYIYDKDGNYKNAYNYPVIWG